MSHAKSKAATGFNGADPGFQFLLCSSDGWVLAGSEKLNVASEIESDKLDKAEGIYLFSRMQGVNCDLAGVWEQ